MTDSAEIRKLAEQFDRLFSGYRGAYGIYVIEDKYSLKKKGKGKTIKGDVTLDLWQQHLEGTIHSGIGIVPINEDSECYWGCIDIDMYDNFDVYEFAKKVKDSPLVVCRSKSGGAHCFMFVQQAIPARLMQKILRETAASLGYSGSEIFPKQVQRKAEGDIGNWLNMPYFNSAEPTRYGIDGNGQRLNAKEFIAYAHKKMMANEEQTSKVSVSIAKDVTFDELFSTGAPCHEALYRRGIRETEDGRNNCLYSIGQQFRRQLPDGWEDMLMRFNASHCSPPLGYGEVSMIINSIKKDDGFYKCKDACCSQNCDKELCRARKYGIGDAETVMPNFTALQKTGGKRDCLWYLTLDSSETIELTTEELMSPAKVRNRLLESMDSPIIMPEVKAAEWRKIVAKLMDKSCEIIEDVNTYEDIFYDYVHEFCKGQRVGKVLTDVLDGKPVLYNDHYWFRMIDFRAFLANKRYPNITPQALSAKLREHIVDGELTPFCSYHRNLTLEAGGIKTRQTLWALPVHPNQTIEPPTITQTDLAKEWTMELSEPAIDYTDTDSLFRDYDAGEHDD